MEGWRPVDRSESVYSLTLLVVEDCDKKFLSCIPWVLRAAKERERERKDVVELTYREKLR